MKVLVTGATGFIGNYVINELLKGKHDVIASSLNIEKAMHADWYKSVAYIPFDIKRYDNKENYYNYFQCPDLMIHLAWEGLPNYKADFHIDENLPRHLQFLSNMVKNGLESLTVTGTCFEYGKSEGCLSEDTETKPNTPYGKAKDHLRIELVKLMNHYSFNFKWIRLFYMYGKGQNPNSLLSQLERALEKGEKVFNMSGGQQVRDFLPIEKVAEYIVKIALQGKIKGIINCCSGEPITVEQFVKNYLKNRQQNISLNLGHYPYLDYEPMEFWGNNTKLKKVLDK